MEEFAAENGHPIADPEVAQMMRDARAGEAAEASASKSARTSATPSSSSAASAAGAVIETIEIDRDTLATAKRSSPRRGSQCRGRFHEGRRSSLPRLDGPFDFVFIDCVKTEYERLPRRAAAEARAAAR